MTESSLRLFSMLMVLLTMGKHAPVLLQTLMEAVASHEKSE